MLTFCVLLVVLFVLIFSPAVSYAAALDLESFTREVSSRGYSGAPLSEAVNLFRFRPWAEVYSVTFLIPGAPKFLFFSGNALDFSLVGSPLAFEVRGNGDLTFLRVYPSQLFRSTSAALSPSVPFRVPAYWVTPGTMAVERLTPLLTPAPAPPPAPSPAPSPAPPPAPAPPPDPSAGFLSGLTSALNRLLEVIASPFRLLSEFITGIVSTFEAMLVPASALFSMLALFWGVLPESLSTPLTLVVPIAFVLWFLGRR